MTWEAMAGRSGRTRETPACAASYPVAGRRGRGPGGQRLPRPVPRPVRSPPRPMRRADGEPGPVPPASSPGRSASTPTSSTRSPTTRDSPRRWSCDRLPRQPLGGRRPGRPRHAGGLGRPHPRVAGRRGAALPCAAGGGAPQRRGGRARALAADDGRAMVLGESVYSVLGDEAPLPELAYVCAEPARCWWSTRPTASVCTAPASCAARGSRRTPPRRRDRHAVQGSGQPGWGGAGFARDPRAPGQHGPVRSSSTPVWRRRPPEPRSPRSGCCATGPTCPSVVRPRVHDLAAALGVEPPAGAVLSVPMPSPQVAVAAQAAALAQGVRVGCFRPPSVPDGISRLRVTVSAGVPDDDWARAAEVLVAVVKEHG